MKKIAFFVLAFVIFTTTVSAADVDPGKLYDINLQNVELVTATAEQAVYSTNTYTQGFFDLHAHQIETNDIPAALTDNDRGSAYGLAGMTYTVRFKKNLTIVGIYTKIHGSYAKNGLTFTFFDDENNLLHTAVSKATDDLYTAMIVENVRYVSIKGGHRVAPQEVDLFVDPASLYSSVSELKEVKVTDTTAEFSWKNPEDVFLTGNKVYLNDELIKTMSNQSDVKLKDLKANTEYKLTVSAMYNDIELKKDYVFKTKKDATPPAEITNLQLKQVVDFAEIKWTNPTDEDLSHVAIFRNNVKIADNIKSTEYVDKEASLGKMATYKIKTYDTSGNGSIGVMKSMLLEDRTVKELKAIVRDFRAVELKWTNPKRADFENVIIYRKDPAATVVARVMSFFSSDAEQYTPLFETNGTTFKDLTVKADTEYTYKVTTTLGGVEQLEGKTVSVKTPKLAVVGGEGEKTENGDYLFEWEAPTTGRVRVDVFGKTFATVQAADKQILIPGNVMKYDAFGNPLITLTPVDENGNPIGDTTTGARSSGGKTGQVELPDELSPKNVLLSGVGLLGVVGLFVLLGLAFGFMPKLIRLIREAFEKRGVRNG